MEVVLVVLGVAGLGLLLGPRLPRARSRGGKRQRKATKRWAGAAASRRPAAAPTVPASPSLARPGGGWGAGTPDEGHDLDWDAEPKPTVNGQTAAPPADPTVERRIPPPPAPPPFRQASLGDVLQTRRSGPFKNPVTLVALYAAVGIGAIVLAVTLLTGGESGNDAKRTSQSAPTTAPKAPAGPSRAERERQEREQAQTRKQAASFQSEQRRNIKSERRATERAADSARAAEAKRKRIADRRRRAKRRNSAAPSRPRSSPPRRTTPPPPAGPAQPSPRSGGGGNGGNGGGCEFCVG